MQEKFRIVVPEVVAVPSESVPDHLMYPKHDLKLWEGDSEPTSEVIDALIEGQISVRLRQDPGTDEGGLSSSIIGNSMYLQSKRRLPLSSWITVRVIPVM